MKKKMQEISTRNWDVRNASRLIYKPSSLRQLAALCANCSFYFGNEGGARHIAQALEIPSFAIYSPSASKSMYKDEERLARMKEHAASFSYEKHIQAYLDLYHELAQLS